MTTTIKPTLETVESFSVHGFKTRTTNAAEGQAASAKFDVTAAVASRGQTHDEAIKDQLVPLSVASGDYLVFRNKGAMPDAVIQVWKDIWAYFEAPRQDFARCFKTDFEQYIGADEVAVHIGVKRLIAKV
jgi:predicted transcriptional regulator YdeE